MISTGCGSNAALRATACFSRRSIGKAAGCSGAALRLSFCSSSFIFCTEKSTVSIMSCWNSGLCLWRSAFDISSDSCDTRFFRSCTTKVDIRLNDSNWRATISALAASYWAR